MLTPGNAQLQHYEVRGQISEDHRISRKISVVPSRAGIGCRECSDVRGWEIRTGQEEIGHRGARPGERLQSCF